MNRKVYKIFKTIEGDNMKKVWKGFAAAVFRRCDRRHRFHWCHLC